MSKDMRDPTRANVGFAANMFNSSHTEPWVLLAFPIARWMLTSDCPSFDLCLDFLPLVGVLVSIELKAEKDLASSVSTNAQDPFEMGEALPTCSWYTDVDLYTHRVS